MQIKYNQSSIITVTTNIIGDIISNDQLSSNPFRDCKNIFEIKGLLPYKTKLITGSDTKKFAINIFKKNYIITQQNQRVFNINAVQFFLTEWGSDTLVVNNPHVRINKELCDIKTFSIIEQEIIFILAHGFLQDKEIINILIKLNSQYNEYHVLYAIRLLNQRFQTNSRSALVQSIKVHQLEWNVPLTVLPPGVYESLTGICSIF